MQDLQKLLETSQLDIFEISEKSSSTIRCEAEKNIVKVFLKNCIKFFERILV